MTALAPFTDYHDLLGKPFEYDGRGPDSYDCWGLMAECFRRHQGIELPDYAVPAGDGPARQSAIADVMKEELRSRRIWVPSRGSNIGDGVLFRIKGFGSHVGYIVARDRFIHVWEGSGMVHVERLSMWGHRMIGCYRHVDS